MSALTCENALNQNYEHKGAVALCRFPTVGQGTDGNQHEVTLDAS